MLTHCLGRRVPAGVRGEGPLFCGFLFKSEVWSCYSLWELGRTSEAGWEIGLPHTLTLVHLHPTFL